MLAEIISVGDELLSGITVNSNAAYIGEKLAGLGHEVRWISTVGDDAQDLTDTLNWASQRARIIVITGGLGPTHDDITKKIVSEFFESDIVFSQEVYERLEERFRQWGRRVTEPNRGQAEVPERAEVLLNDVGTAPGLLFSQDERLFFVLPGVPAEMRSLMEKSVIPRLERLGSGVVIRSRFLRTTGIPESDLYRKLRDAIEKHPKVRVSFLPKTQGVVVRLVTFGNSVKTCEALLSRATSDMQRQAGRYIYGMGETLLEEVVVHLLQQKGKSIAVAESCTGGLIGHKLTNVPGSSATFERAIVAYSDQAKKDILKVPQKTIQEHGAVSLETARAMAEGVRRVSGTDIGLSTTGIAGPGGARPDKPVGLIYIGYADETGSLVEKHLFPRDRWWNKERSAVTALDLVRRVMLGYTKISA